MEMVGWLVMVELGKRAPSAGASINGERGADTF